VVEAVVRSGFDDVVDVRKRVDALSEWKKRDDFESIVVGFKRVSNILKDAQPTALIPHLLAEPSEKWLHDSLLQISQRVRPLIQDRDYSKALEIMAELKDPIDQFFDNVMVMVEDDTIRNNRLALLFELGTVFRTVADFSVIGSTAE